MTNFETSCMCFPGASARVFLRCKVGRGALCPRPCALQVTPTRWDHPSLACSWGGFCSHVCSPTVALCSFAEPGMLFYCGLNCVAWLTMGEATLQQHIGSSFSSSAKRLLSFAHFPEGLFVFVSLVFQAFLFWWPSLCLHVVVNNFWS